MCRAIGRVAEKVIIIGNNFGNDKSVVTVLFTDNMEKENKAAVVGVDNTTIYCMAPRQAEGFNKITVKVNDQRSETTAARLGPRPCRLHLLGCSLSSL